MSRAVIILNSEFDRRRAVQWVQKAPAGCRIEFKQAKRSIDQNSRLWAHLTDIATHAEHNGRKYSAAMWKIIFLSALGREVQFIPSLDGKTFIPFGQSSSDLSKQEMTDLITLIESFAAERGIQLHDTPAQRESA